LEQSNNSIITLSKYLEIKGVYRKEGKKGCVHYLINYYSIKNKELLIIKRYINKKIINSFTFVSLAFLINNLISPLDWSIKNWVKKSKNYAQLRGMSNW